MNPRRYRSAHRAAAAEQTRARLLAAASELLSAPSGARGFSLEAVARAAGVTRLTVYNQFGSRRALLEAVFDLRAAHSDMHRVAEAMHNPDALEGLKQLIGIFCDLWAHNRDTMARLHATGVGDPDFEQSLRERNERRRSALQVLIERLSDGGASARADAVDMVFALTSFHMFVALTEPGRSAAAAGKLIEYLAVAAISAR